eukprot:COSAG03_NODE_745_length_6012_cov_2.618975_3_plen_104_part_00
MPSTHCCCQWQGTRDGGSARVRAGGPGRLVSHHHCMLIMLHCMVMVDAASTQQQVENHPLSSRRSRLAISSGSAACSSALPTAIGSAAVVVAMIDGAGQQLQV